MTDWRAPLMSAVCYLDPRAAIAWLEQAFGFEVSMLIEDPHSRAFLHQADLRAAGAERLAKIAIRRCLSLLADLPTKLALGLAVLLCRLCLALC